MERKLLIWKANHRAILSLRTLDEIKVNKEKINSLIIQWINAAQK